ncbi:MAG: S-methyl-5'-thioadenosine phosphorylase [Myxococcales bacterium]|nr:S-methyl-5'-thioadenosine phosphorylase [Myxococcales bacterium]
MAVGVIGGSGLYQLDGLEDVKRVKMETPYGDPSDAYIQGVLHGTPMFFLPRHGLGHRLLPTEINFRANIWGFKKLGCERLISVSAVGSMKENIAPGDLVMIDQFIDWTRHRNMTFLGEGIVGHVALADPISLPLQQKLFEVAGGLEGVKTHRGGTYICIEGPQFSTRAESKLYRSWGVDVIGMTNMPEARLAREAEISYATIALATDYDSWKEDEDHVETEAVLKLLQANVEKAKRVIEAYARGPKEALDPVASTALRSSLITPHEHISPTIRKKLDPILAPFLSDLV